MKAVVPATDETAAETAAAPAAWPPPVAAAATVAVAESEAKISRLPQPLVARLVALEEDAVKAGAEADDMRVENQCLREEAERATTDVEGVVRAAAKEFLGHQSSKTYKKGKGATLFAFCLEHYPDFAIFILERADLGTRHGSSTEGAVALLMNRKALMHFLKDRIKNLRRRSCRRDPVSGHHPHQGDGPDAPFRHRCRSR